MTEILRVDDRELQELLKTMPTKAKQAAVIAVNRTAEEALAGARTKITASMIVRVPRFTLPPIQLPREWKATQDNPNALLQLGQGDPRSIGGRRQKILEKFEDGGTKVAKRPDEPIAIPTKALRPSPTDLVDKKFYPKNLRVHTRLHLNRKGQLSLLFAKQQKLRGGGARVLGKRGTFVLDPRQMRGLSPQAWGIYERTGPGPRDIRKIWTYRKQIPIPSILGFREIVTRVVAQRWQINMEGAIAVKLRGSTKQ